MSDLDELLYETGLDVLSSSWGFTNAREQSCDAFTHRQIKVLQSLLYNNTLHLNPGGVDDVIDTRMSALNTCKSQFYEWLPRTDDALDEVPESEDARIDWLQERWRSPMSKAARQGLTRWYEEEQVEEAQHAESFQIAEYGRQPTEKEIRRLFPIFAD